MITLFSTIKLTKVDQRFYGQKSTSASAHFTSPLELALKVSIQATGTSATEWVYCLDCGAQKPTSITCKVMVRMRGGRQAQASRFLLFCLSLELQWWMVAVIKHSGVRQDQQADQLLWVSDRLLCWAFLNPAWKTQISIRVWRSI